MLSTVACGMSTPTGEWEYAILTIKRRELYLEYGTSIYYVSANAVVDSKGLICYG